MMHTELSWYEMSKVPAGRHSFISHNDAMAALSAPSGSRPRIYAYAERGQYAGQIVKLTSVTTYESFGDDLGFAWVSDATLLDFIHQA